eukprot:g10548.t1
MGEKKPVICVETGEVFPSLSAAARHVGRDWTSIRQAIQHPCKAAGFTWEWFEDEDPELVDGEEMFSQQF